MLPHVLRLFPVPFSPPKSQMLLVPEPRSEKEPVHQDIDD